MLNCFFVGAGGFIGSVLRYLVGQIPLRFDSLFPYKTLLINVLGAFLIGVLASFAGRSKALDPKLLLTLKVGVCGGFTTFSTFAYEISELMSSGHPVLGVFYALLSIILGVSAVLLGLFICKSL